jgi:hypothetical protein
MTVAGIRRRLSGTGRVIAGVSAPATIGYAVSPGAHTVSSAVQAASPVCVPAQFIAKQYTAALGRIPDQPGWQSAVSYFQQNGCSVGTLARLRRGGPCTGPR